MLTLEDIKGVGGATVKKLNDLGIHSVFEVFSFLPKKYIDLKQPTSVFDGQNGQLCLFEGVVESVSNISNFGKKSFYVVFRDSLAQRRVYFRTTFFNLPYLHDTFEIGQAYRVFGRLSNDRGIFNLVNPQIEKLEKISKLDGIYTVYPLKNVMGQNAYKNIVVSALDSVKNAQYSGPLAKVSKDIAVCFDTAHRPSTLDRAYRAIDSLASIDLAIVLSLYKKLRISAQKERKVFYKSIENRIVELKNNFEMATSINPTQSQDLAFDDICADLCSSKNMSRVISGDVGSGKTLVAFFAMYVAKIAGHQSVLMAPTEILVEQHSQKFAKIAEKLGINCATLTSSTSSQDRKRILGGLKYGKIDCVIGTNSVVGEDVVYKDLSLAIIDEQHRFGVSERGKLESKGACDILSLTATPIPRSMALTFYEDIKISRIEKRASATTNITTSISTSIDDIIKQIVNATNEGRQAFIVCPSIYDAEGNEMMSIESFVQGYGHYFDNLNVSIMHGKLSNDEKAKVMEEFSLGKTQVLIATTVIEVGIDTLATEIAILNADRFGLATLHQLRGRVGRDGSASHCYLHTQNQGERAIARLSTLCKSNDGQYLAEVDFEMRGSGDFLGTKQSGKSLTPIFSLQMNASILKNAKIYAQNLENLSQNELLALTHQSRARVSEFIKDLQEVTLNS